jgi:hypothetical protein
LRAGKALEKRGIIFELSDQHALIERNRIGILSARDMFFREGASCIDGADHVRRPLRLAEAAVGIGHVSKTTRELPRRPAAQHVRNYLNTQIGERAHHRQKQDDIDPRKDAPRFHGMHHACDLDKDRTYEEQVTQIRLRERAE